VRRGGCLARLDPRRSWEEEARRRRLGGFMEGLSERLYREILKIPLIDPHSHIDPHRPTASDLDDLLGYHYYTELAHSAGMDRSPLGSEVPPERRARAIAAYLPAIDNTVQYSWLLEIARELFGFSPARIDASNIDELWNLAEGVLNGPAWEEDILHRSRIEKIFLTNDFDDPLEGFNTERYVPCLRTDDLVFRLGSPEVVERLREASRTDVGNAASLKRALEALFRRFKERGAKACAISLPPSFAPDAVEDAAVDPLLRRLIAGKETSERERETVSRFVFWSLAEMCREHRLPFDLMIGVVRNVYAHGVYQGRDLYDRLTSLHRYAPLFNAFPDVIFPISVLPSDLNQELVAYSWIFPNVMTSGHWWYSNVPVFIERDLRARLEAVPRTKQIGYYSDMYKLEFGFPKFNMYRRALAKVLAESFVVDRGWKEEDALALARDVLRTNVERVFFPPSS
jgi:glucuronate isomerase